MRNYMVVLIQLIIWSGYTLTEWLSKHDESLYNVLMFGVFMYIAVISGNYIVGSKKTTICLTALSLCIYGLIHGVLNFL